MRSAFEGGDAVRLTLVGDVDVDLGGADVDVAGERADDLHRDVALREHRAEGVSQGVGGAPRSSANAAGCGVLEDDIAYRSGRQRLGPRGAARSQADEQRIGRSTRPAGVPALERQDGIQV